MFKCNVWRILPVGFFIALMLLTSVLVFASGNVTFRVHVVPGFALSVQDELVFNQVTPGQTVHEDLLVTVWSNVNWGLLVAASSEVLNSEGSPYALQGRLEARDYNSIWNSIVGIERTLHTNQDPTPGEGRELSVPFRFNGDFQDLPDTYTLHVEFTVVPQL